MWICKYCSTTNEDSDATCIVCDARKEDAVAPIVRPAAPTPTPRAPASGVRTLTRMRVRALGLTGDVVIPAEFNVIGEDAFLGSPITSVVIHENVKRIEKKAFANCIFLRSVTVKGRLNSIGARAFYNCIALPRASRPTASRVAPDAFATAIDERTPRTPTPRTPTPRTPTPRTPTPTPTPRATLTPRVTPMRPTPAPAPRVTPIRPTPAPAPRLTPARGTPSPRVHTPMYEPVRRRSLFASFMKYSGRIATLLIILGIASMVVEGLNALIPYLWWTLDLPEWVVWTYSAVSAIVAALAVAFIASMLGDKIPRLSSGYVAGLFFIVFMAQCIMACYLSNLGMYDPSVSFVAAAAGIVYALSLAAACIYHGIDEYENAVIWIGCTAAGAFIAVFIWAIVRQYI